MILRLKPNAKPVRVRARRYSPQQSAFMRAKTDEFLRLGLIRRNNASQRACAPLIVPKTGSEKFRFTVDLRPLNRQKIPHVWTMPHLETMLSQLTGAECFATLNFCQGYWQLAMEESSQECCTVITPHGIFSTTRVLHGLTNAVSFFQRSIQSIYEDTELRNQLLQWLDDILLHAKTEYHLILFLHIFSKICRDRNLKLHANKVHFFLGQVGWCGRLISKDGIKMDPACLQGYRHASANPWQRVATICLRGELDEI